MKLVGPWFSPFTRRVGITLHVLELPYEHLPIHAFDQKTELLPWSPMTRVPVLVTDEDERLVDSSAIAFYLDELVGPERALVPVAGPDRRRVLQVVGIASAVIEKVSDVYHETLRPEDRRSESIAAGLRVQAEAGLDMLERLAIDGAFAAGRITQADILAFVAAQTATFVLGEVALANAPKLASAVARGMADPRFASTLPRAA